MKLKQITNPADLVPGKIYSDTHPEFPFTTFLQFEKLDEENTMYFRYHGGENKYIGQHGLIAFENDFDENEYPFYELP